MAGSAYAIAPRREQGLGVSPEINDRLNALASLLLLGRQFAVEAPRLSASPVRLPLLTYKIPPLCSQERKERDKCEALQIRTARSMR